MNAAAGAGGSLPRTGRGNGRDIWGWSVPRSGFLPSGSGKAEPRNERAMRWEVPALAEKIRPPRAGLVPEQCDQDEDRDRNAEEPKEQVTHSASPVVPNRPCVPKTRVATARFPWPRAAGTPRHARRRGRHDQARPPFVLDRARDSPDAAQPRNIASASALHLQKPMPRARPVPLLPTA